MESIKHLSTSYYWNIEEQSLSNLIDGDFTGMFFDFAPDIYTQKEKSFLLSVYFSDKIQLSRFFELTPGYRGIFLKKANIYFNSPYLSINYNFNKYIKLTASYGLYHEYFYTKRDLTSDYYFAPFASYFIVNEETPTPISNHFSLGIKVNNVFPSVKFEAETYYKSRNNIYSADALTKTPSFVSGYAAGIDLLLKKETGIISGWIAYSFSHSVLQGSYKYFTPYDRTHNIKLLLNFNFFENWKINAFWTYDTGLPYTSVIGKYPIGIGSELQFIYSKKNSMRYENYHRLDLGITGNFIWWDKIIAKPYLQVMNVYNNDNPFNYKPKESGNIADETESSSTIIPTIGITIEF